MKVRPSLRDTSYARELVPAVVQGYSRGNEIRLERLLIKSSGEEEIRLSWWKNGRMAQRPADLPEDDLVAMIAEGLRCGVLDPEKWQPVDL